MDKEVKSELIGTQSGKDPITGRFVSGNKLGGRTLGSTDFKTKWENFIERVAKEENKTPREIDEELFDVGLAKAKSGDYAFYRDIHDRIYGKPQQSIDHTTGGEKLGQGDINLEDKEAIDAFHTTLKNNRIKRVEDEHSRLANPKPDKE